MKVRYALPTGLSALALALAATAIGLSLSNASLQQEFNTRQGLIQQGQQVSAPLFQELVQTLGSLAIKGDKQITDVLAGQGITVTPNPPGPAAKTSSSKDDANVKPKP